MKRCFAVCCLFGLIALSVFNALVLSSCDHHKADTKLILDSANVRFFADCESLSLPLHIPIKIIKNAQSGRWSGFTKKALVPDPGESSMGMHQEYHYVIDGQIFLIIVVFRDDILFNLFVPTDSSKLFTRRILDAGFYADTSVGPDFLLFRKPNTEVYVSDTSDFFHSKFRRQFVKSMPKINYMMITIRRKNLIPDSLKIL